MNVQKVRSILGRLKVIMSDHNKSGLW